MRCLQRFEIDWQARSGESTTGKVATLVRRGLGHG